MTCPSCAPKTRDVPDLVIPFYERDLCKVQYTAKGIAMHDLSHNLGNVFLMWVSKQPSSKFANELHNINKTLSATRQVKVLDFSEQVNAQPSEVGWFAQQVVKLKIAHLVTSEFYIVLDSKNTFIRDVTPDLFFNSCNQAKLSGDYRFDKIPPPHSDWYERSSKALQVDPPAEGYWPTSITPILVHKQTVLDMLSGLGEDPDPKTLCKGPLCKMLGMGTRDGKGASEFTMYLLYAYSRDRFRCSHAVVRPEGKSLAGKLAVSLWRGLEEQQKVEMQTNIENLAKIARSQEVPYMFGAQLGAFDPMPDAQRQQAIHFLVQIFENAKLYRPFANSPETLKQCIIGGLDTSKAALAAEEDFCCTAASNPGDSCGSCVEGFGKSEACGTSEKCSECGGAPTWCSASPSTPVYFPIIMRKDAQHAPLHEARQLSVGRGASLAAVACVTFGAFSLLLATRRRARPLLAGLAGIRDVRWRAVYEQVPEQVRLARLVDAADI